MATTVLQGSAYRTIKCKYDDMFTRESAMYLILKLKRKMWPDGVWREPPPDYTDDEISLYRRLLMETLPKIVPGAVTSIVGQNASDESCLKLWEFLQSPTLLRNYMFCLLDKMFWHIFRVTPQAAVYRARTTQRKRAVRRRVRVRSNDNEDIATKVVEEAARTARARALRRRSVRLVGGILNKIEV